jgi:hypothetical protein
VAQLNAAQEDELDDALTVWLQKNTQEKSGRTLRERKSSVPEPETKENAGTKTGKE